MPSSDGSRILFDSFSNNVNGRSRNAPEFYHGVNPATREPLWNAPVATYEDVNDAVLAAENAFHPWSIEPFEKRAKLLGEFAELYASYEDEFTELLVRETGKPVGIVISYAWTRGRPRGPISSVVLHDTYV